MSPQPTSSPCWDGTASLRLTPSGPPASRSHYGCDVVRGTRFWVVVGLLTAVVVTIAAVLAARIGSDDPEPVDGDVVIIGDSVTHMSADQIERAVGAEGLEILAAPGYRSTDLLPVLQRAVDERGGPGAERLEKAAFLVGYNDVLGDALDENVLAEMVELSSEFECAVWLSLPTGFGDRTDDILGAEVDRHASVHLDHRWAEAVEADRNLLTDDGVHPTEAGMRKLAEAYRDALNERCDPGLDL